MPGAHQFSRGEEIANALSHGIGALLSFIALLVLVSLASIHGDLTHILTFIVFGVTMFLLYISSTLVHALPPGRAKHVFEIIDHAAIYMFIAGSVTPFAFIVIQGKMGWFLFVTIWLLAIAGTVFKIFFVGRFVFLSTLLYVLMGWLVVLGWSDIRDFLPTTGVALLVGGGLAYTVGSIFFIWRWFKYHHVVWHLFVLMGSVMHFLCVVLYLVPY